MSHWPFVLAAYAIALGATAVLLLLSWRSMRRAEQAAQDVANR
ncbi:MAG TPA: heme exporter protein CcmD [Sphingomicrobium sp.]|nr:heme exporter protein CcmD [Sphingomicrobium sp.]